MNEKEALYEKEILAMNRMLTQLTRHCPYIVVDLY